jgi:L-alanine-DL-glutamate epimerase-like enolase superfamily enzyme
MRDPIARITLEDGSRGFGFSRANQQQAEALLGAPLNDLISVENGVSAAGKLIDFALWDALGQRAGKPVYALAAEYYGTPVPEALRAPCYDTSLYFDDLDLDSDEEAGALIAQEAMEGWACGHRAFKMKVGRGALHMPLEAGTTRDIAVIHAVRQAIGPDIPLMIDANNGWNVNLAKQVLSETADCDLCWLEEPFHEDEVLDNHLQNWMRERRISVLLADGEGLASPRLMAWAQAGAIDVVQYDLRDVGLTHWLKTGKQLDDWGVRSAPHNYGSNFGNYATCHLAGVIANFTFVEWDAADTPALDAAGYQLIEGFVHVPDAPGFGLKLDEALFQQAVEEGGFHVQQ